ncbi:fimbrial protein [Pantoea dispersa]|uniref:fimbria/pilus chaperone family protein n=1 Tax=Pantoea TaxID=53335 RepID=UPI00073749FF|nr:MULTISPECIES: fimbria/pilus chaperone family protein [Pantoea]KTS16024.1 fimbrial protein [Pantoea dispersa]KTS87118.1 fimbrial protein [Pantoea dispersa]NIG36724.1 fimbria/pilus periplasmic chaperone [Pantoea sp. Ap-959]PPC65045.1 fimbrial protein [Pantoea sp. ICBG 828]
MLINSTKKLFFLIILNSLPSLSHATGMLPDSSVVIIEEKDREGNLNIKNTDNFPVLLLTTIQNIPDDQQSLLTVTPPAARVEAGKAQRIRFMLTTNEPLKTERLKRVTVEGIPPQEKGKSELRMTVRQNLPVIIRPAGLEKDLSPWKRLNWKLDGNSLQVKNDSPYVVRLAQVVQTLPDKTVWQLPNSYVLPGQQFTLSPDGGKKAGKSSQVRISPATTWGFSVDTYDAPLTR